MPTEQPVSSDTSKPTTLLLEVNDQRESRVAQWDQLVRELDAMTDETDTPELWDEVLRNLARIFHPTLGH